MQQRKAICTNWMRELRRMSRELSAVTVSMKAQDLLLPLPSAEETLFDFINEDEVKVLVSWLETSAFFSTTLVSRRICWRPPTEKCCGSNRSKAVTGVVLSPSQEIRSDIMLSAALHWLFYQTTLIPASLYAGSCLAVTAVSLHLF